MRALADFVTRFPKVVLALWAIAALVAAPFAAQAPAHMSGEMGELKGSESSAVTYILQQEFTQAGSAELNPVLLVVRPSDVPPTKQAALLEDYAAGLSQLEGVSKVRSSAGLGLASDTGLILLTAQIPLYDGASTALDHVRHYTAQFSERTGLSIGVTGGQAVADDFTSYAEADTKRSELLALPLIAAVLLVVFGALTAAGLPLLVGVLSIALSMAVLYGLSSQLTVATFAQSMVTMLGLGAGIDYALLMVSRFREELAARAKARARAKGEEGYTHDKQTSKEAAHATILSAGRAVLWSGSTVAIAMAGLLAPPVDLIQSIGFGGVATIGFTVLAAITALPAAMLLLGDWVNRPRIPGVRPERLAERSSGWVQWAHAVMRRPTRWLVGGIALLLIMASPIFSVQLGYMGAWSLAPGIPSRDALSDVRELGAGGLLSQFEIVLRPPAGPYDPARHANDLRSTVEQLEALEGVQAVISPFFGSAQMQELGIEAGSFASIGLASELNARTFSPSGEYIRLTVIPDHYLRANEIDPLTAQIRRTAGPFEMQVGGAPIGEREFSRAVSGSLPQIMLAVFAATFVLLMVAFRSLLVPLKSIVLNGLTVAAAIGAVIWVTSGTSIGDTLGFVQHGGVLDVMLPLLLFTVMFGLSMDYEIFLMSRIYEGVRAGKTNADAVADAIGRTARIITSAALIMLAVFVAFIAGRVMLTKSIGLGLAVAIVLDATLVRLVLVPALMQLAGRWNWWLPHWLARWLPKIELQH